MIREPKSGKEAEVAFMPEQIAKRLNEYIKSENLSPDDRIFPVCYSTARTLVKKKRSKTECSYIATKRSCFIHYGFKHTVFGVCRDDQEFFLQQL